MKNYKKYILPILFGLFIISSGYSQALCEPVYNVDKQVQIFSVGDQMYPDPSCNPASESCYNTFATIGQPFVNTATQYWDADANEYDTDNSLSNYTYSSSSVDNINSFGFFNDYISEPKPPKPMPLPMGQGLRLLQGHCRGLDGFGP